MIENNTKTNDINYFANETPRVLLVNSQNIYKNNATGITMRSMWGQANSSSVLELYRYKSTNVVDDSTIHFDSIQIPAQTKPLCYWVRKIMRLDNYYDGEKKQVYVNVSELHQRGIKRDIVVIIKALLENERIWKDKAFLAKLDAFSPEIIYTMGASFYIISWALFLAKRYNIPIVIHYMDNWRETIFMDSPYTRWLNRIMTNQLKRLEKHMHCGLVISEKMAESYTKKYGGQYLCVMNSVEFEPVIKIEHKQCQIIYAGGLHLNRDKSLLAIAKVLQNLKDIRLLVYTSISNRQLYEAEFAGLNVEFRNAIPHSKISTIYEEADILLHIESFEKRDIEFTRYSMSTKIPEYMLSGKPIICFAPNNIAVYEYLKDNCCALCIDRAELIEEAVNALNDEANKEKLTKNAILVARKNHSREQQLQQLIRVLKT